MKLGLVLSVWTLAGLLAHAMQWRDVRRMFREFVEEHRDTPPESLAAIYCLCALLVSFCAGPLLFCPPRWLGLKQE